MGVIASSIQHRLVSTCIIPSLEDDADVQPRSRRPHTGIADCTNVSQS
jgi:hypothetical protein